MGGKPQIAFIGTGIMGAPMARNLLKAGYAVTVYNRTRAKAEALAGDGASVAETAADAAAGADVIITMLPDTPDVEAVLLGEGGVAAAARAGSVVIDMSTISPEATRRMAAALGERGIEMLDAPVSGGDKGAIAGTLSIMVGGKREVFERCRPVFEAMGKTILLCGPHGAGQLVKLCNQIAGAVTLLGVAEAVAFARAAGADPEAMIQAVGAGAAGSWAMNNLGPRMAAGDFAPGFMVDLMLKDLRIVEETASRAGQPLEAASLARALLEKARAGGDGREGTQAVYKVIAQGQGKAAK